MKSLYDLDHAAVCEEDFKELTKAYKKTGKCHVVIEYYEAK